MPTRSFQLAQGSSPRPRKRGGVTGTWALINFAVIGNELRMQPTHISVLLPLVQRGDKAATTPSVIITSLSVSSLANLAPILEMCDVSAKIFPRDIVRLEREPFLQASVCHVEDGPELGG